MRSRNWFSTNWNILALSLNYKYNNFHQFNLRTWGFLGSRYAVGNLSAANRVDDISKNRDLIKDRYKNLGVEARYVWKYYIKKNLSSLLLGGRFYTGVTQKIQGFGNADSDANFGFASPNLISSDFQFPGMNVALFSENVFTITLDLNLYQAFDLSIYRLKQKAIIDRQQTKM
jgi:Fe(3+) dicitrate transport protein